MKKYKPRTRKDRRDRFWSRVQIGQPDDCWPWLGGVSYWGYGNFTWDGRRDRLKQEGAHRAAWMICNGPIPEGIQICHTCDNPRCCNPSHLFLGTQRENLLDMVSKGRSVNASKTHCPQGHPYDEANTHRGRWGRHCRRCNAAAVARYQERREAMSR